MHPIFGHPRRLMAYLGASLLVGLLLAAVLNRQGLDRLEALALVLPACPVYAFACLSALYVCLAAPLKTSSISRVLATAALAAAIAAAVWLALLRAWYGVLDVLPVVDFDSARYPPQVPLLFTAGVLLFLLSLAVHYAMLAFDAVREAERCQLRAEVLARDAQLSALRAQLDPHFLYNSLNSINALTSTDPAGARRMCLLLGDFLRQTMHVGSRRWIPLAEELALAERFLDIEQVRFGARLRVERHADQTAAACRMPPLLLQPLVENAVTHGIARRLGGGVIRVDVARRDGMLSIAIENPRETDGPPSSPGLGLDNVRQRIAAVFGDAGRLDAHPDGDRFRVELSLPCSTNDDDAD
jgi:two-component system, LytTR family, sensor histidine kinase AlgZ